MTKTEVVSHFGSLTAIAKALGLSVQAVQQWKETPPLAQQFRLEALTNGVLKVTPPSMPSESTVLAP